MADAPLLRPPPRRPSTRPRVGLSQEPLERLGRQGQAIAEERGL